MGQYYHPTLIGSRGGVTFLYSHEYNNGLKLMEHSYLGNNFVNAVMHMIFRHPMKVAWIGDYSGNPWDGEEPYQKKITKEQFEELFNKVYGDSDNINKHKIHPEPLAGFEEITDFTGWYLVNHTQRVYIDMKSYADTNKWHEVSHDWVTKERVEWDMCVHPLPLLTACGNGRGGGDYYGNHPGYDKVGTWAFDVIEFTTFRPEDYGEVFYHFTEQEVCE